MISTTEVRTLIEQGEVIEDYPEDPRGHSCLMFGKSGIDRAIHVVRERGKGDVRSERS